MLLAPLAGITNLPFRMIAREYGCDLCFTEMISANGLIRESAKTIEYLKTTPADRPLGVQIFGAEPGLMAEAAKVVAGYHPDLIDINMGCPVKKVVKTGSGAALMKDPLLAGRIIRAVVHAVNVPVTVKIRSGWNRHSMNAGEMARVAEDAGAAAIIIHGRTADQGFSGHADWSVIARVKNTVDVPVIGNGDIWRPEDARRMFTETGCDAVMIGRATLGNPWIFRGIRQILSGKPDNSRPDLARRLSTIRKHWDMETQFYSRHLANRMFRKHLLWYTKGLPDSGRFRDNVGKMTDSRAWLSELERYFRSLTAMQPEIMT